MFSGKGEAYGRNEYFGFTQREVGKLLQDTDLEVHAGEMKEWYNGGIEQGAWRRPQ